MFDRLLEAGATIIVIDHDLDLLATADHLIDMGPGGGPDGGHVLAAGPPGQVARNPASVTGPWLAEHLGLTTGAMTKMLDRLQRAGYITRSADPHDRRRIIVTTVPATLAEHAWRWEGMGKRMNDVIARYSASELAAILDFMRAGRQAADAEIALMRERGHAHAVRHPAGNP